MKLAILGAGRIAGIVSATLSKLEEIDRYAVAARDLGRAKEFAKTYGYQKAYGSYEVDVRLYNDVAGKIRLIVTEK